MFINAGAFNFYVAVAKRRAGVSPARTMSGSGLPAFGRRGRRPYELSRGHETRYFYMRNEEI